MLLAVTGFAATTVQAATPPLAKYLPAQTTALVSTSDFHAMDSRLQETFLGRAADAPSMAKFVEQFESDAASGLPWFGASWADLRNVVSGSVALATARAGEDEMGFLLLAEVSGRDEQVQAMFDRFDQSLADLHATRAQSTVEGQHVETIVIPGKKTNDPTTTRVVFRSNSLLAISDQPSLIAGVLQCLSGKQQRNLSEEESFAAVIEPHQLSDSDQASDITWYVAPWQHLDLLVDAGRAEQREDLGLWRSLGFDVVKAVGGEIRMAHNGRDFDIAAIIHAPGPRRLTAEGLAFHPLSDLTTPSWVPADAATFAEIGWDLAAAFRAYGHWFDAVYGEGESGVFEDVLLDILEEEGGPQVDVRKELVDQLKRPVAILTVATDKEGTPVNGTVFSAATDDEKGVSAAVGKMLKGDPDVASVTIHGHSSWVFREMQPGSNQEESASAAYGPDLSGMAFCVSEGRMWTSTEVDLLKTVFVANASSDIQATRLPQVRQMIQHEANEQAIAWQYSNLRERWRSPYLQLRTSGEIKNFSLIGLLLAPLITPAGKSEDDESNQSAQIDWTLLPDFEEIQMLLPPAGFWVKQTNDGWRLFGFALSPATTD